MNILLFWGGIALLIKRGLSEILLRHYKVAVVMNRYFSLALVFSMLITKSMTVSAENVEQSVVPQVDDQLPNSGQVQSGKADTKNADIYENASNPGWQRARVDDGKGFKGTDKDKADEGLRELESLLK